MADSTPQNPAPPPLEESLEKSKQATEAVKQSAEELAIIHEVLDAGLATPEGEKDVERAVERTGEIEKRLNESAETLDQVNEALEKHVAKEPNGSDAS